MLFGIFLKFQPEALLFSMLFDVTKRKYTYNFFIFVENYDYIKWIERGKYHGFEFIAVNEKIQHQDSCREYATISTNIVYGNFKSMY